MRSRSLRGSAAPALFLVVPLTLAAGGWTLSRHMAVRGFGFFERGKSLVDALDRFAHAAQARNREGVGALFAADYRGRSLGFNSVTLSGEKDGVRRFEMRPDSVDLDRASAIAEWHTYLNSFDEIESVGE